MSRTFPSVGRRSKNRRLPRLARLLFDGLEPRIAPVADFGYALGIGATGSSVGESIATDGGGNVYVTGEFYGTVDFDPGPGTFDLTSPGPAGTGNGFVAKYDPDGHLVWAGVLGGTSGSYAKGIAVDANGNVYVTGYFTGTADLDPTASGTANFTSHGSYDIFVTKLTNSGNLVWAKTMGGTAGDQGEGIAVDGNFDVYITGLFDQTASFDPNAYPGDSHTVAGSGDNAFIEELDPSGNDLWTRTYGTPSGTDATAITLLNSVQPVVIGTFSGTGDFNPGSAVTTLSAGSASFNAYALSLDSSGNFQWADDLGGTSTTGTIGEGITYDPVGHGVYVSGYFSGTANFNPSGGGGTLTSAGGRDGYVAKLGPTGFLSWVRDVGGAADDEVRAVAANQSGVSVVGDFYSTLKFPPSSTQLSASLFSTFVAQYDPSGNLTTAKAFSSSAGTGLALPRAIALDPAGDIFTTGYYHGSGVDFDPSSTSTYNLPATGPNSSDQAIFVSRLLPAPDNAPIANNDSYAAPYNGTLTAGENVPGLLLHSGFDESSSGTAPALDTGAGPVANGTFEGGATRIASTLGGTSTGALDLTANGAAFNEVASAPDPKIDGAPQLTITLWVNLQADPSDQDWLIGDTPPAGQFGTGWSLRFVKNGSGTISASDFSLKATVSDSDGGVGRRASTGPAGDLNANHQWVFVALTLDSTGGPSTIYAGSQTAAVSALTSLVFSPLVANNSPLEIGGTTSDGAVDRTPPAWIDDVRVYNSVLSTAQLDAVRQAALSPPAPVLPGVLANDSDADNDAMSAVLDTNPAHGTVTLQSNGSFTYTPNANYEGPDSFTYSTTDGLQTSAPATVSIKVDKPPTAANGSIVIAENKALPVTLSATDPDADPLTYTIVTAPAHGTLSGTAPNMTYTPNAGYYGPDSFTFKANDGALDSNIATVSIRVNAPPVTAGASTVTLENAALPLTLSATDPDADSLTYTIVTAPAHGTLSGTAPNMTYTPNAGYHGPDSFTFKANDGTVDSNTATVSIKVDAPPTAAGASVVTVENNAAAIVVAATDPDNDPLTYSIVAGPTHGTLSGTAPNVTYTPNAGYFGPDSFIFKANDGTVDSNTATVSIKVDAPPTAAGASVAAVENGSTNIALSASDPDADPLTYSVVAGPAHGTLSGSGANLTYTPTAGYLGPDSFTFKANDATVDSNTATVSINVQALPVANSVSITTGVNAARAVTLSAADADSAPLTYTVVTPPAHGTLTGTAPNLTYTPSAGYVGPDSFTFKANDGPLASNTATISIKVDAPPVATAASVAIVENSAQAITLAASDPENDPLTYAIVTAPAHGTFSGTAPNLTYTPNAGYFGPDSFTFKANDGTLDSNTATVSIKVDAPPTAAGASAVAIENNASAIVLSVTDPDGDPLTYSIVGAPAHGTVSGTAPNVTYTPNPGYFGPDSFTFKANDGTVDSNTATISIRVDAPPNAAAASVVTVEGASQAIVLAASDADADPLTYTIVTAPAHGTLTGTAPNLTYTPAPGYFGPDGFTFKANDGIVDSNTASVSIRVDAPATATGASVDTLVNAAKAINLAASDPDGDPLTYTIVAPPAHGALTGTAPNLTYTPTPGYFGLDGFTFKANDGTVDSNTATVSIKVDTPPTAADASVIAVENSTQGITLAAADPDGDSLTYGILTLPAHGTLSGAAPNLVYTPTPGFFGPDSFTFKANDGTTDSNAATISIRVDAPPAAAPASIVTLQDSSKSITLAAADPDRDSLTYAIVAAPAHGTLSGTAPNVTYTPSAGYFGPDSFAFKANDGTTDSNAATVSIKVDAPPTAAAASIVTLQNSSKDITLTAADPDGDSLTYAIVGTPAHGTLSGTAPNVTYTPSPGYFGPDSFTFKANDGTTDSNTATVSIKVDAPPTATGASILAVEGTAKTIGLVASDPDADPLAYTIVASPAHGTLTGTAPNLTYTPASGYLGPDSFTFKVNDSTVDSNTATVSINVQALPVADNASVTTGVNVARAITLSAADADNNPLNYTILTPPAHGALSGTAPNLTYTPNLGYFGPDSFTFKANDGSVVSNTATVSIKVDAAPVAAAAAVVADENGSKAIALAASDPDGDSLTDTIVTAPAHGTLSGTAPNLTYTPNAGYFGPDSFTFKANDGTVDSNTATISIKVDAPPIASAASLAIKEDRTQAVHLVAADPDGDPLTFTVVTPPVHGTLSGSGANLTYTPAPGYVGPDSFAFEANDGATDSNTATVTLSVARVALAGTVSSDFNGDGVADIGIYQPDKNAFALDYLSANDQSAGHVTIPYGYHAGTYAIPITGDFNGDGITDVGIYQPNKDLFALDYLNGHGGSLGQAVFHYGFHVGTYAIPITGDFNGDGITDVGIYQPNKDLFALDYLGPNAQSMGQAVFNYGYHVGTFAVPITGDFNGDGVTDVGVYQPNRDFFALDYLGPNAQSMGQHVFHYGYHVGTFAVPITGDFNGDGVTDVGIYQPNKDLFALDYLGPDAHSVGQNVLTFGSHTTKSLATPLPHLPAPAASITIKAVTVRAASTPATTVTPTILGQSHPRFALRGQRRPG